MLENQFSSETQSAAQTRVNTSELTEALASLEARHARRDYERVGTVTLADGIRDYGLEMSPEELLPEVERLRSLESAEQKAAQRYRRLKLILKAELVSAALCLLALAGLHQTIFNSQWQQAQQTSEFQHKLQLSTGLHPKYNISVVPISNVARINAHSLPRLFGSGEGRSIAPLYTIPDGYNIYHSEGLDNNGHDSNFANMPFMLHMTTYVEFREDQKPWFRDNVSVFYNGRQYWRGWIRRQDIPRLQAGHAFTLYPALVSSPQFKIADDLVPLTLSMQSIEAAHGQGEQAYPELYNIVAFPEGSRVTLDQHAWEFYHAYAE